MSFKSVSASVGGAMPGTPSRGVRSGGPGGLGNGLFSLGRLVARVAPGVSPMVAWGAPAAALGTLAFWDVWARGGSVDAILLGLAAYELLIGLTENTPAHPA